MPDPPQHERIARNEHLFRSINQDLARAADRFGAESSLEFMCECARVECCEHVSLTMDEYRALREHPARFAIIPSHQVLDSEIVVHRKGDQYAVVEKIGRAGDVAAELYAGRS